MQRSPLSHDQLLTLYYQLLAETGGLPFASLQPGQRRARCGWLIPGGDMIVEQLGKGLRAHPDLFPDMPGKGDELLARQRAADGWLALFHLFSHMARRSWETYMAHQSDVTEESFRILHDLNAQGGPDKLRFLRAAAVMEAYVLVDAYYRKLGKNRQVLKEARRTAREQAARKLGVELPAGKPKSRQKLVAERAQVQRADAEIRETFLQAVAEANARSAARRRKD